MRGRSGKKRDTAEAVWSVIVRAGVDCREYLGRFGLIYESLDKMKKFEPKYRQVRAGIDVKKSKARERERGSEEEGRRWLAGAGWSCAFEYFRLDLDLVLGLACSFT